MSLSRMFIPWYLFGAVACLSCKPADLPTKNVLKTLPSPSPPSKRVVVPSELVWKVLAAQERFVNLDRGWWQYQWYIHPDDPVSACVDEQIIVDSTCFREVTGAGRDEQFEEVRARMWPIPQSVEGLQPFANDQWPPHDLLRASSWERLDFEPDLANQMLLRWPTLDPSTKVVVTIFAASLAHRIPSVGHVLVEAATDPLFGDSPSLHSGWYNRMRSALHSIHEPITIPEGSPGRAAIHALRYLNREPLSADRLLQALDVHAATDKRFNLYFRIGLEANAQHREAIVRRSDQENDLMVRRMSKLALLRLGDNDSLNILAQDLQRCRLLPAWPGEPTSKWRADWLVCLDHLSELIYTQRQELMAHLAEWLDADTAMFRLACARDMNVRVPVRLRDLAIWVMVELHFPISFQRSNRLVQMSDSAVHSCVTPVLFFPHYFSWRDCSNPSMAEAHREPLLSYPCTHEWPQQPPEVFEQAKAMLRALKDKP